MLLEGKLREESLPCKLPESGFFGPFGPQGLEGKLRLPQNDMTGASARKTASGK